MNRKVFITMLILTISFLAGMYILKIFFPQEFVMCIENERLVVVGNYVDDNLWLYYLCCGITAFITYWLYCCACSHRLYLKWYECLYIIGTIIICRIIALYDTNISTIISCCSFLFLPALTRGDIKTSAVVYTFHCMAQVLSLKIRNLQIYMLNVNFIFALLITFECYLWLVLFYIIFNYRKGDCNMGLMCPPVYGKSKFYENKKAKALKIIAKQNEIIKVCDEEIAKAKANETKK